MFRSTTTKDGDIFYVEDKEIGLRELAMNVAIPTDPGQRTVKGDMFINITTDFDKKLSQTVMELHPRGEKLGDPASLLLPEKYKTIRS